jgi:hypothetical protein
MKVLILPLFIVFMGVVLGFCLMVIILFIAWLFGHGIWYGVIGTAATIAVITIGVIILRIRGRKVST